MLYVDKTTSKIRILVALDGQNKNYNQLDFFQSFVLTN